MKESRQHKLTDLYRDFAAEFLELESSRETIITVMRVILEHEGKSATCLISVYPPEREETTLAFAKRRQGDFRNFVASKTRTKFVPTFTFDIDKGEKNRRRIEELLSSGHK